MIEALLKTGMVLAQYYEIKGVLGQGGNARVYLACDRRNGRNRAVKELEKKADVKIHNLWKREAELIRKLGYPYFPEIFESLETEQAVYLVMEYLEGETLQERLDRLGPLPWQEVCCWGKDLCLMLSYLHQWNPSIIYRDMKPENVMIQSGGNLRLIDFGAVTAPWAGEGQELLLGTRGYAAPEQYDWRTPVDARTDVYGLGATMYQLLTGKIPGACRTEGYSIRREKRSLPRRLDKIIRTCTRREPGERYPSCEKLREALCGCCP